MNYLGLDYGEAKIGIAIATGLLAEPLTTINTNNAIKILEQLIQKHQIDKIIIGLPDGPVKSQVEEFIQKLRTMNYELITIDETLSSHDAREGLLHTTPTKRRLIEHQVAAALILQSYLDSMSQK